MNPFLDGLKKYQQKQSDAQQIADARHDQSVQAMLKWMGAMQQGQQMGVPHSQLGFGPAGLIQRQGLGTSKGMPLLPEEFVVAALVGWRRWGVTMFGEELLSNRGTKWEPFKALKAECSVGVSCQGTDCGCGIYAYKERSQAETGENSPTAVTHIWGEVHLWGRVVEHTKGFRAQFAYPKAFVNTGGIAQRLAVVYGVPLINGDAATHGT